MPLTPRQKILYKHTVNIYVPVTNKVDGSKLAKAEEYFLAFANVPCMFFATPELDIPDSPQGRSKEFNVFTLDRFHFLADQDLADTYVIELTTPNHPMHGLQWRIEGNSQLFVSMGNRRANYQMVMTKRIPAITRISS